MSVTEANPPAVTDAAAIEAAPGEIAPVTPVVAAPLAAAVAVEDAPDVVATSTASSTTATTAVSTTQVVKKKNVVVIGGSCVAISTMLTAKSILPSTHRLIIIERHSHFHYMFAFPRATVISGWENELFVPYTNMFESPDKGLVLQAIATKVTPTHIELDRDLPGRPGFEQGGNKVEYEYLIYATGARHPEPGNLNLCDTKESAIARLKEYQEKIKRATKVLLIGGGAVGLELAVEIREHFPEKEVTLVHSRDRYMGSYKYGLHEKSKAILRKFGVRQILGDRAVVPEGGFKDDFEMRRIRTRDGQEIECDLQILCTGMTPQSGLLQELSPSSVDPTSKLVKVLPTLQIVDPAFPNIFSAGDVADLEDVKTGGAAWGEADLCIRNICKLIAHEKKKAHMLTKKVTDGNKKTLDLAPVVLKTHTPMAPQIFLYYGMAKGAAQLKMFGKLFTTNWDFLLKRFFVYNVHATRSWTWLGTPMTKETVDL